MHIRILWGEAVTAITRGWNSVREDAGALILLPCAQPSSPPFC